MLELPKSQHGGICGTEKLKPSFAKCVRHVEATDSEIGHQTGPRRALRSRSSCKMCVSREEQKAKGKTAKHAWSVVLFAGAHA